MHNMDEEQLEQLRNVLLEQIQRGLQPHLQDLLQIADGIRLQRQPTLNRHFHETDEQEAKISRNDDEPGVKPHPGLSSGLNYVKTGSFKRAAR